MREIMDAFCDPEVPGVAAMLARQMAKTESLILNAIGYHIHVNPTWLMVLQPTTEDIKEFSSVRITGLIEDCPEIRVRVADARSRDGANSTLFKKFKGGFLKCASTGSYRGLIGRAVRLILMDEVDSYEMLPQGHPIDIVRKMMSTFWNAKEVMLSTPLNEETSVIYAQYLKSSMGEWFVPCPACEHGQVLTWSRIQFRSITHTCESCGRDLSEHKWKASQLHGEHRHKKPETKYRGYHVSALASPWIKWKTLIDEFLEAQGLAKQHDYEKLKGWRNMRMAEPWKGEGEKVDYQQVYDRREIYDAEVPDGVCLLVATVDPGQDYMDWEVAGWGFNGERWGIETGTVTGDPHLPEIWQSLENEVLNRSWSRGDGRKMKLSKMLVDSGFAKRVTCQWTKAHQPLVNSVFAIGRPGLAMVHTDGYTKEENARIWTLGSWELKDATVAYLRVKERGPAFWHYPMKEGGHPDRGYDIQYFQQLCDEKRILTFSRKGYSK
jgi:phage terminase large subunit GpA-like protein